MINKILKSSKYFRLKQFFWDVIVNSFLSSCLAPIKLRVFILKIISCQIGENSCIQGNCYLGSKNLKMGSNSYINRRCLIDNGTGAFVIIGDNCSVGFNVNLLTTNHIYSNPNKRGGELFQKILSLRMVVG